MSVIDLEAAVEFWQLKDEIMEELLVLLRLKNTAAFTEDSYKKTAYLMHKIESLGKKEGE